MEHAYDRANNMIARLADGQERAAIRRHRGLTTGKSAAGWDAPRSYGEEHSWHEILFVTRTRWELARDEAINVYASLMFPERYEDIPF